MRQVYPQPQYWGDLHWLWLNMLYSADELMWRLDMWPQKWSADDTNADVMIDAIMLDDHGRPVTQPLLVR